MREPMLALLLGGGLVYLSLGDVHEALILPLASIAITVAQESRTERALEALRDLTSLARWSFATGYASASPAATWCAATWIVLSEGIARPADGQLVENADRRQRSPANPSRSARRRQHMPKGVAWNARAATTGRSSIAARSSCGAQGWR